MSRTNRDRRDAASDGQLMSQIQAGSANALGELYDRYCDQAYRIAFAVCRDADLAEDAVQGAFLSVWGSGLSYRAERGTVAAWLLTCVRHRAIDVARSEAVRAGRLAPEEKLETRPASEDTAGQAAAHAEAERLHGLLELLPEDQRVVITLAFYGGLTHTEIAAALGLPIGTVKGRMRLGLDKLRTTLERVAA